MPAGGNLCFFAGSLLPHQQFCFQKYRDFQPEPPVFPAVPSPGEAGLPTFSRIFRYTKQKQKTQLALETAATGVDKSASSIWLTQGRQDIHRCFTGDPISSPQGFLLANPPGPYTCLRTVNYRSAAMLPFHLKRLWESADATGLGPAARQEGQQALERRTTETIAKAMESFFEVNADIEGGCPECMVTVLYKRIFSDREEDARDARPENERGNESSTHLYIMAHCWPLPMPQQDKRRSCLKVLVAGSGRLISQAKHSSWLRDRRHLDALKAQVGAQEVALSEKKCSEEGAAQILILEGLTSNIFVVEEDGAVCTAPSGILPGGIRQLLLAKCKKEGIPFRLEYPDVSRAHRWREAFLTGTGRILAPISSLLVLGDEVINGPTTLDNGILSIPRLVSTKIEPNSPGGRLITIGQGEEPSMAHLLRKLIVEELEIGATRLF